MHMWPMPGIPSRYQAETQPSSPIPIPATGHRSHRPHRPQGHNAHRGPNQFPDVPPSPPSSRSGSTSNPYLKTSPSPEVISIDELSLVHLRRPRHSGRKKVRVQGLATTIETAEKDERSRKWRGSDKLVKERKEQEQWYVHHALQ